MDNDNILITALKELGIKYSPKQLNLVNEYLDQIYEYNKTSNLIGTKDKKGIRIRHILDSISILKYREYLFDGKGNAGKVIDVGTGAGLPGMILSIFLKDKLIYLLDKKERKIEFLSSLAGKLKIENVRTLKGRAEELARENLYRESFDIVLARAVARFSILCELVIPFCRINGKIIFYKSIKVFDELKKSREAISRLGGRIESLLEVKVPYLNEFRAFLIINKYKKSPEKYPRKINKIKNNPLR